VNADALKVEGLSAWYGRARILADVSMRVGVGEVALLLGRNGAGKSTTLAALMGLAPRIEGRIHLRGRDVSGWPAHRIARAGLGYVPEDRRVFADLTVRENLSVGRQPPRDGGATRWTETAVFDLFPALAALRDRRAGQMSGGEQQMLTIARTLMGHPCVLLLDEPGEGLAPRIVATLAAVLGTLKAEGLTIVLSEQAPGLARAITDRVCVLETGRVRFAGTLAELDARPDLRQALLAV